MVTLADAKDPNELHKQKMKGFQAAFRHALDQAEPFFIMRAQPASPSTVCAPFPFTLQELLARELPPVRWAIPDILPEGLTLLAGKPKQGKSWLALSVALAVAAGGVALGKQPVTQGEVLYLALEDNERRLQSRARQLLASMTRVPNGIAFELHWPRLDQGGFTYLEEYLQRHPGVRLVVVDTWAKVAPQAHGSQRSQYESDYEALTPLKHLADTYRVSILAVHHLRKTCADDVMDEITGSIGIAGAVDGALILKRERGQHEATLFVTGRDIEQEQQLALTFDPITAMWTLAGNAEDFKRTKERQEILALLTEHLSEGMSPRQVAEALDKNYHTTRSLLRKMEDAGEIRHVNNQYSALANTMPHNQCHQSRPAQRQEGAVGQVKEYAPSCIDYGDDTDYADYSDVTIDDRSVSDPSNVDEPPAVRRDTPGHPGSGGVNHLQELEDRQQLQDHGDSAVITAPHRNQRNQRHHCNQSEASLSQEAPQREKKAGNGVHDATDEIAEKEPADTALVNKRRCPHHPHTRWVRFDPSGQAWCDKMDCWDCYRLMKIGEALGYQQLSGPANTVTIAYGTEAWASFVISQPSLAVLMATQQAIVLCKALEVEVPDLSDEVQRLIVSEHR